MVHDHSLIYKDKERLEEYTGDPKSIGGLLYSILLNDILDVTTDANRICGLFNEAYWICTRVMIDPHPELHVQKYFPLIEDVDSQDYKEQVLVMSLVYGLLLMYQTSDMRFFHFYTRFHRQYKEVPAPLKTCSETLMQQAKDGVRFEYEFPAYWGELRHLQLMIVRGVMEERYGEIYNWVDFLDRPTNEFDMFYIEQLLGIMTEEMQITVIQKWWAEIDYLEKEAKSGRSGLEVSKYYPDLYRSIALWHHAISKGQKPKIAKPHPYQFMGDDPMREYEILAKDYYNASRTFFLHSYYPRMEADEKRALEKKNIDERIEHIVDRLAALKKDLWKSGFMKGMMFDLAERDYHIESYKLEEFLKDNKEEVFGAAIESIRPEMGEYDEDCISRYFYQNRNSSNEASTIAFHTFVELGRFLANRLLSEVKKRNEKLQDIEEDKDDGEYDAMALAYYDKVKERYMKEFFLGVKESFSQMISTFGEGLEGWNDKATLYDDLRRAMIESGFIKHYVVEDDVYDEEEEKYLMMGDEDYADTMLTLHQYQKSISDLEDEDGHVDVQKAARYIYEYKEILNDTQLNTYFNWVEGMKYVEELLMKRHHDPSDVKGLYSMARKKSSVAKPKKKEETPQTKVLTCQFFSEELRSNHKASVLFLQILENLNPEINKSSGRRATKIKWPHIRAAWEKLNLMNPQISRTDFGVAVNSVIKARTEASVSQTFKPGRINDDFPNMTDDSIIADIVEKFKPVRDILSTP